MALSDFPIDYQELFHALPDNFLLIAPNPEATILDNTDRHEAVSLKPRAEVVGKAFFEAYPATDEESARLIRESHAHVRRYQEPHTMPLIRYDLPLPAEQGGGLQELYWEATHYPVLDANGQLQFILQRTQDVTKRHQQEQQRLRAQAALAEQQERNRFILEAMPMLVWTARPDGVRDYFNPRWLQFTGRPVAEEMENGWFEGVHPNDLARVREQWAQCIASGQEYQLEYRLRRADGQYRWVLMRGRPHRNEQGHITMWVGGGTDIHDQKKMVEEMLETNEQQALLSEQAYQAHQLVDQQRSTFYNLLTNTSAMICILRGPEHRFEFVNPVYQSLFPGRQLEGHTVAEVMPEVVEQGFGQLLDEVYATGKPYEGRNVPISLLNPKTQQLTQHFFNFTYQRYEEQGVAAGISVFAFDVSEFNPAPPAAPR